MGLRPKEHHIKVILGDSIRCAPVSFSAPVRLTQRMRFEPNIRSEPLSFGATLTRPAGAAVARYRAHLDALARPYPVLEWGFRWCELRAPPSGDVVLVHQDFRTGNYLVDEGTLTGILDWEFAAWGDPMSDIGGFCAKCGRFGRDDRHVHPGADQWDQHHAGDILVTLEASALAALYDQPVHARVR